MTNDNSPATTANDEQPPRRRRMRRRDWLLTILGVFMCLVPAAWFTWGWVGQNRLDELVAAIRSRGEPVEWKELAEPPVPEDQNAVPLYQRARDLMFESGSKYNQTDTAALCSMTRDLISNRAFRRQHGREAESILALSRDSLALVRQATTRPGANFKTDFTMPAIQSELPPLASILDLADSCALAALSAHEAQRDAEALRFFRDTMALGRCMGTSPLATLQMVSVGCYVRAFPTLEQIAPDLRIGPEPDASAATVRELIGELLNCAPVTRGWTRAMFAERAFLYDNFERLRRGELCLVGLANWHGGSPPQRGGTIEWLLRPLLTWDEVTCLLAQNSAAEGANQATYPDALRKMNDGPDSIEAVRRRAVTETGFAVRHLVGVIMLPDYSFVGYYNHLAQRRLAATALAMRLYEVEKGKPVAALEDLVAAGYLKELPADPFSDKGEPIRYKSDPKQPLLYSVGKDGRNDGGAFELDTYGDVDRKPADLVFFLKGDRPTKKVDSTRTVGK